MIFVTTLHSENVQERLCCVALREVCLRLGARDGKGEGLTREKWRVNSGMRC